MKTVRDACTLQPKALDINVGDQIEQLDELIKKENGSDYFKKTFITDGMRMLLTKGIARLAGKSKDSIFHLKQAMGGGKTHIMIGFGLLAKDNVLRKNKIGDIPYQENFGNAKVAAFNGRNNPETYFWGEIASQLGKEAIFKQYWEGGPKAPDEKAWLKLFDGDLPILILLDEMPPYFHYYNTQALGNGTVADVITRGFSNMLTAAQKKSNVAIVVSDLEAAYDTGGKLIQKSLDDATQELGRAEISITPVNLESNEIYEILRKRLFETLPHKDEIVDVAEAFSKCLKEAAKAKTVERSAESLAEEVENTYPFHPSFKNIVALFKQNEKFKQTRGLMELVSRLLKSVWNRKSNDVFLIGVQHFDLSDHDVREKLADISDMREVIARDLWDSSNGAHAQIIDLKKGKDTAMQVATLLFTASLSTAVNSIKGLSEAEMVEYLIDPHHSASEFKKPFEELLQSGWYLHETAEGRHYFDKQENLTKKLQGYAEKAPPNKVDELIRDRLYEMYKPTTKEAYGKVLPLPEIDEAEAALKTERVLLIISPDGKTPPEIVRKFYQQLVNKNNLLVLTGDKSQMANIEIKARYVYATLKTEKELSDSHPQRKELDEKKVQYSNDFEATILVVFDKLFYPSLINEAEDLRSKPLDTTYPSNEPFNGEKQIIKTLTVDPIKLYTDIKSNFDAIKARAEQLLFTNITEARKTDLTDRHKQKVAMPWLPPKGFDELIQEACQRGIWEDLGNGIISKKPRPKKTDVIIVSSSQPNDDGTVRLKIETLHAGNAPRIHFSDKGNVSEQSEVLKENELITKALRVQFLAVDPSGKNETGEPKLWKNTLVIRNQLNPTARTLELFVAPFGNIKYSTDGSEARNGIEYKKAFKLDDKAVKVNVFAEADGIEAKATFSFPEAGSNKVQVIKDKKAVYKSVRFQKLENVWQGVSEAKASNIEFEDVKIDITYDQKVINLSLGGNIRVNAEKIEKVLNELKTLITDNNTVTIFSFKKAYFANGHDLENFAKNMGIEINVGEVIQE